MKVSILAASAFIMFASSLTGCKKATGTEQNLTSIPVTGPTEGLCQYQGTLYAGMALSGEVYKIDPNTGAKSLYATFPSSKTGASFMGGIQFDSKGVLYAAVVSFDPAVWGGVYKVPAGGGTAVEKVGTSLPFANGLRFDKQGNLYVTDSKEGRVYRINPAGQQEVFSAAEELKSHIKDPNGSFDIGVNGIDIKDGFMYLSNTDDGTILRIEMTQAGQAGTITKLASGLAGADGLDFDTKGNLYIPTNRQNKVWIMASGNKVSEVLPPTGLSFIFPSTALPIGNKLFVANLTIKTPKDPGVITVVSR